MFVTLPFIGGFVGYHYAPEKVVEVERVVKEEIVKEIERVVEMEKIEELNGLSIEPWYYSQASSATYFCLHGGNASCDLYRLTFSDDGYSDMVKTNLGIFWEYGPSISPSKHAYVVISEDEHKLLLTSLDTETTTILVEAPEGYTFAHTDLTAGGPGSARVNWISECLLEYTVFDPERIVEEEDDQGYSREFAEVEQIQVEVDCGLR